LYALNTRVYLSGSALQFKNDGAPIDEANSFEATSAYSVARIQSLYAARYYRTTFKLNIFFGYLFNHDSSMRSELHVNQKIVSAVKRIAKGSDEKIELGNINIKKEFNYAGDIVEAIWLLINQNNYFEAVIGSGISYSIRDWLEYCFKKINKNWEDFVILNPDKSFKLAFVGS
jgi:GDPmannose 4,6-dehydratase